MPSPSLHGPLRKSELLSDLLWEYESFVAFCGMSLALMNRLLPYSFRQIDLASGYGRGESKPNMRYFATILITLFLTVPAMSVELFRYRGAAKEDGETLEYVFEAGEQNSPAVTKEKAAGSQPIL